MLKKFAIITGALAFGAAMTTPASAHDGAPAPTHAANNVSDYANTRTPAHATPVRASGLWQQIADLERDVNRAEARKTISRKEAASVRRDIAGLKQQFRRYNANGISPSEARTLDGGIAKVRHHLQGERHDFNRHTY